MGVTKRELDQAFAEHKTVYGGARDDYFPLLYLTREFEKGHEQVAHHVAFGGDNAEGINAFHVDVNRRNLYLFVFASSTQHQALKEPLKRLAHEGMERIFGPPPEQPGRLLAELHNCLHEDQAAIDRVLVHLVFNGNPADAEQSATLGALCEDLESKKYLIDRFFKGREVSLTHQFISNETRARVGAHVRTTHRYDLKLAQSITAVTEGGPELRVGFVSLLDLYRMYREMRQRLFERNIRAGLDADGPVNRKIRAALADIVAGKAAASAFVFNHNGVTLSAEEIDIDEHGAHITEPRVLNGAQTITSVAKFIESYDADKADGDHADRLEAVQVLAKIVSRAPQPFITAVTINTNRQNPVEPVNLRASDAIQLELQDKFRGELDGMFYERQERAFQNLTEDDLEELGFDQTHNQPIQIKALARTFLAAQGEVDRMSRLNDVFETENQYRGCFSERYLKSDARRILLAYKIQYRLTGVAKEIIQTGGDGYWYAARAKNVLWALLIQAVLNHSKLETFCESYGVRLTKEADFGTELKALGSSKVRLILREALMDQHYKDQLNANKLSFLRTKALYLRCMEIAEQKYGWKKLWL